MFLRYYSPVLGQTPTPKQPVLDRLFLGHTPAGLPSLLDLPWTLFTRSGRSALLLALRAAGTKPGDGVLVPTYHCPTMIAPVEILGATPVFYPIDWRGLPDLGQAARMDLRNVKAMLVPHLFGLPQRLEDVASFCRERGITLIEDCAHCFFGDADGVAIGSTGDFAIGSLPKFFPVLEGGILASREKSYASISLLPKHPASELRAAWDIIDLASRHGRLGLIGKMLRLRRRPSHSGTHTLSDRQGSIKELEPLEVRRAALNDPLLEPAFLRSLEKYVVMNSDMAEAVQKRHDLFNSIADAARACGGRPLVDKCAPGTAPYVVPVLINQPDAAYARLRALGQPVFRWDRRWPGVPRFPNDAAEVWSRGVIQIACHQSFNATEQEQLLAAIAESLSD